MNRYTEQGYVNIKEIMEQPYTYKFICGGKSTGKTYSSLKYMVENKIIFLLLRRTQTQMEEISREELSPFNKINQDMNWLILPKKISKYLTGFYKCQQDEEKGIVYGELVGYCSALSTFSRLSGFNLYDVQVIIYDEFIATNADKRMKDEYMSFAITYDGINRNRDLPKDKGGDGLPPVQVLFLANAHNLNNPIMVGLQLVRPIQKMLEKNNYTYLNQARGVAVFFLTDSPISQEKRKTAFGLLTKGTDYERMALNNEFVNDDYTGVVSRNLQQYNPLVTVGEITIYKHKVENKYYVSPHSRGNPPLYNTSAEDLQRFKTRYNYIWWSYLYGNIEFEDYSCKLCFEIYNNFVK